ncbi:MAG: PspC domain-containing protein [Candidatus Aenigmatarchaeota archaeon]
MPRRKKQPRPKQEKYEIEKQVEHFAEEADSLGRKASQRIVERHRVFRNWWHRTFGFSGPFIAAVIGIFVFFLLTGLIKFVNTPVKNHLLSDINSFLLDNTGIFFLLFVLFSYASYFSTYYPLAYRPFSPLVTATGITASFWLVMNSVNISNFYIGSPVLFGIGYWMEKVMFLVFGISVFAGYIILVAKFPSDEKILEEPKTKESSEMRRLYRSGKDKVLGGVCGGIGEYFHTDPVLVRIAFIILALLWGFGIILYIICWIIIPRNPSHRWR